MRAAGERTLYPHAPGSVSGSATSQAAADTIGPKLPKLQAMVLGLFEKAGSRGLTDDELQAAGNTPSVLRPRRIELTARGFLRPSGRTRPTVANREAEVWIINRNKGQAG